MAADNMVAELVAESIDAQPPVSPVAEREAELNPAGSPTGSTPEEGSHPAAANDTATAGPLRLASMPSPQSMTGSQPMPETFNPDVHVTDDFGNPVKNANGSYRKKAGRKKGQGNGRIQTGHNGGSNGESVGVPDTDNAKLQVAYAAASTLVQSMFILGRIVGGDDFLPIVDAERGVDEPKMLTDAWTQYFLVSDIQSIPPWLGVAIATGSFFLTRLTMPQTQSRLGSFFSWIKGFFTGSKTDE